MKKYIYPLAITATLLATTACSDDEVNAVDQPIPDSQKEMISFSLSDGAAGTRAGFTTQTRIIARIQSDEKGTSNTRYTKTALKAAVDATNSPTSYSEVSYYDSNTRYWDDAFGRKAKLSVYAVAIPNSEVDTKLSFDKVSGGTTWATETTPDNTIAWDVVTTSLTQEIMNAEDLVYSNNIQEYNYSTSVGGTDGIYRWNYTANAYKPDNTGEEGTHKNGQMLFYQETMTDENAASTTPTSAPGHFDKGHLKFKHALSRMTIILIEGDGFDKTSDNKNDDFKFASATENLTLLNMYVKGVLDIRTGVWTITKTPIDGTNDNVSNISLLAKTTSTADASGTYIAQMLPDYVFTDGSSTNVMQFTIDNNTYYVTQDMLFDALTYDKDGDGVYDSADGDGELVGTTGSIKMQQGKNYTFKITVNKTKIEKITASLAPWIDVTAANKDIDNSHVSFTLTSPTGSTKCTDIQFYRFADALGQIYTNDSYITDGKGVNYSGDYKTEGAATLTEVNSKYQTNWFYDDNKTAYHFRTINALAADESGTSATDKSENLSNSGTPNVTSFTMKADASTKDYHWGAPMKSDATFAYSITEGYKSSLYPALISTKSDINITELHMMSNINIVLKTTTEANKVDLTGATVTLTKLSTSASVDMGVGLVAPIAPADYAATTQSTTPPATYWENSETKVQTKSFTCSAIPQSLVRGSDANDYVGLTITTANGNQYFVSKLSEIVAESINKGDASFNDPDHPKDSDNNYQAITRWYPNHTYTYTFTLSKTAIENITASVAQWVNVTAGNSDISLQN